MIKPETTCPKCKRGKTRYEVKIKNAVREYWICWPCYDERKINHTD